MKHIRITVLLLTAFNLPLQAQNSEDVVKDVLRFTNAGWFQSAAQPGKKGYMPQPIDSVLIEYTNKVERRIIPIQTVVYKGEFKNGLFHGKGKLQIKRYSYPNSIERPAIFSYEGDFENGIAQGKGFMGGSWSYQPRDMQEYVFVFMNCQAEFENGLLKRGLVRVDHTLNNERILTSNYSGELYLKDYWPVSHGLGIVHVMKTSPNSEMAKVSPGIDGGLYAGHFYFGEYTGFAICNYLKPDKTMSNLLTGVVGKGEILHTFSTLPLQKNWTYQAPASGETQNESFIQLFGDFKTVKNGTIYIDQLTKYTGGIQNDLPHGIGYIENGNGFYDLAFWNHGKRLSLDYVLRQLLPDSSMVAMKKIKRKVAYELMVTNGTRTQESIRDADYFGKLNAAGNPEGWGVLLCKLEPGYAGVSYTQEGTIIGNFKGVSLLDKYHENDFLNLINNNDNKQVFVLGLRYNKLHSYQVFIPAYATSYNRKIQEYYSTVTPYLAAIETESFKPAMDAFVSADNARISYIQNRKAISVKQVVLSSLRGNSYVETITGEKVPLEELPADKVNYGDYVLYKDVFYEVSSSYMFNDYIAPRGSNPYLFVSDAFKKEKCYVLKGYWMQARYEPDPDGVCPSCGGKPPGKSTYTGVGYTGRSETNVYANNSGGINIVSKPIVTVTTVTVDNKPCKFCLGVEAKRRVKVSILRN